MNIGVNRRSPVDPLTSELPFARLPSATRTNFATPSRHHEMPSVSEGEAFELSAGHANESDKLGGKGPTQEELTSFVATHAEKIRDLSIETEDPAVSSTLDFRSLSLPKLRRLTLINCQVKSLVFTTMNTPALKTLTLSGLRSPPGTPMQFELQLPELETLSIEHIIVDGPCNFGLCLSRSPKLQSFTGYKFRYLSGHNYCILPKCEAFNLTRSEATNSLEILQAPCLERLSVGASYDMHTLRLWDFPYKLRTSDVENLESELEACANKLREQVLAERGKWKNGMYGGHDAYKKGWIDKDEIRDFDFAKHPFMDEELEEDLNAHFQKHYKTGSRSIWNRFVELVSKREVAFQPGSLPVCQINHASTELNEESMSNLRANKRVELDDEYDEWF